MERLNSGEQKIIFRIIFCIVIIGLTKWKSSMAGGGGGEKKRFQYCSDSLGTVLYLRALQGHAARNLIDLSLQDTVLIPNDFFEYIYHIGCCSMYIPS